MKNGWILLTTLLFLLIPQILFTYFEEYTKMQQPVAFIHYEQTGCQYKLRVKDHDEIREMELDEYILGVVLGEMPAEFELEALKAQAVASRTYTLRSVRNTDKHPDADICTDASCCQAFISVDDYTGGSENLQKVRQAVEETADRVVTYEGDLIEATYFSCSGGQTEDAVAVWGNNVPYLQSVSSPGEEEAKQYSNVYIFSVSEFKSRLGIPESVCVSNDEISLQYTNAETVSRLTIGDMSFSGMEVRTLLSLSSAAFAIDVTDQGVAVCAKGNGHRVGMSQYGADAMALNGKTYEEILTHYYTGTQVVTFTEEQLYAIFDKEENL